MAVGVTALVVGKEIISQASGAISGKITALVKGAEQVLTPQLGGAFFAQLNARKVNLYSSAAKDTASSLWNDSNRGNAVAMVVSQAAKAAQLPTYYERKIRAVAFRTFGNTSKANAEEAKAGTPPTANGIDESTATNPSTIAIALAVVVGGYLLLTSRK